MYTTAITTTTLATWTLTSNRWVRGGSRITTDTFSDRSLVAAFAGVNPGTSETRIIRGFSCTVSWRGKWLMRTLSGGSWIAEPGRLGMSRPTGKRTSYLSLWREFLAYNSTARRFGLNRRLGVNFFKQSGD